METFSASLALCEGNPPVTGGFPSQGSVTRSFGFFVDLRLNKRLGKHSMRWWFETLSRSLWRQYNDLLSVLCACSTVVNTTNKNFLTYKPILNKKISHSLIHMCFISSDHIKMSWKHDDNYVIWLDHCISGTSLGSIFVKNPETVTRYTNLFRSFGILILSPVSVIFVHAVNVDSAYFRSKSPILRIPVWP